ncbi:MAG: HD domain-containing phosphohydrolase [Candidatus Zixiibacteriota bacterium]
MSDQIAEKILVVDDDSNLLSAVERQFRRKYTMVIAGGGKEGIRKLKEEGPFAVVISDMRMPDMNGIQFLAQAQSMYPNTVRIMLTGNADIETAMHAVNEGNIFRFLLKPCHKSTLEWALEAAVEQHRLLSAERELVEKTLKGSVQVLTDILALVNPVAFSRISRLQSYVSEIAERLEVKQLWQYELAALLSQIGCVTIPPDTLAKFYTGANATAEEREMFAAHPHVAARLLGRIPRLRVVAEMIADQQMGLQELGLAEDCLPTDPGTLGGQILRTAIEFDTQMSRGNTVSQAMGRLKSAAKPHHPFILNTLMHIRVVDVEIATRTVSVRDLNDTMILAENIRARNGLLVAAKGQHVNSSMRTLLRNYVERRDLQDGIGVTVPIGHSNAVDKIEMPASLRRQTVNPA